MRPDVRRTAARGLGAALGLALSTLPAPGDALDEARARLATGDPAGARALLTATVDPAREADVAILLARAASALGDWESAIRHARRAVELRPQSAEAHFRHAEGLRVKLSSVARARAMLSVGEYRSAMKRAIELDPRHVAARREEIGFLTFAPGIVGGDTALARRRIAELEPIDWAAATFCRAQLEAAEENFPAALAHYAAILERHPDDGESRAEAGLLLLHLERHREADEHFAQLERHADRSRAASALYQRGRARILGGFELERAAEFFERYVVLELDGVPGVPSKSSAYRRLGDAYAGLARTADARRAYERAIALDPGNAEARKALGALPRAG